ncbi:MAG: hypothetical protein K2I26_01690 [Paramuribaculum sp.]|nr:hypothetical protein [Paramuribaculum sp.]
MRLVGLQCTDIGKRLGRLILRIKAPSMSLLMFYDYYPAEAVSLTTPLTSRLRLSLLIAMAKLITNT